MYKLFLLPFLFPLICFSQRHDTLYVSHDKTLYTLFDSDVDLVNVGSTDYEYELNKNMVMVVAVKPKVPTTSLMVKTKSGEVFVWYIAYRQHPPRLLEDTRPSAGQRHTTASTKEKDPVVIASSSKQYPVKSSGATSGESAPAPSQSAVLTERDKKAYANVTVPYYIRTRTETENRDYEAPDEIIEKKMFYIMNQKRSIKDIGEIDNSIYFMLHDLYVDKKYIYIKMSIHNTSSIAFDIDFLSFERSQEKTIKKREGTSIQPLDIMYKESVKSVSPSTEEIIVYAVSLFAFEDKDQVLVKLSELGGVRTMKFVIPAKLITNAKFL